MSQIPEGETPPEPPLGAPIYDDAATQPEPDAEGEVVQARIATPTVEQAEVTHVVITPWTAGSAGSAHRPEES